MSEALAAPRITRSQREQLAANAELRQTIVDMLRAGKRPPEIAKELAAFGVTAQRCWNINTQLERAADRRRATAAPRRCLGCGHVFQSWGAGNRRCDTCVKLAGDAGPYEASFGPHVRLK
jgi:hypothetical protein